MRRARAEQPVVVIDDEAQIDRVGNVAWCGSSSAEDQLRGRVDAESRRQPPGELSVWLPLLVGVWELRGEGGDLGGVAQTRFRTGESPWGKTGLPCDEGRECVAEPFAVVRIELILHDCQMELMTELMRDHSGRREVVATSSR